MTNGNLDNFDPLDKDDIKEIEYAKEIIISSIKKTSLDLSGLTILTEAASGHWRFTPFIALFSNATKVICISKNSKYGTVSSIKENFNKICKYFKFDNRIEIVENIDFINFENIDIVTNSGHVRPIDKKFVSKMNKTSVISLMWEPWEFRESDIDLSECWKKGIPVLGVNENNAFLNIMNYNGDLMLELFKKLNLKFSNKNIIFVIENKTVFPILQSLKSINLNVFCISESMHDTLIEHGHNVIGNNINDLQVEPYLKKSDIIIVNSFPSSKIILGTKECSLIKKLNPKISVLVYFGIVDYEKLKEYQINYYPKSSPISNHMSWTIEMLGPKPIIELSTIGLKVTETPSKCKKMGMSINDIDKQMLKNPFYLSFSGKQKKKYFK